MKFETPPGYGNVLDLVPITDRRKYLIRGILIGIWAGWVLSVAVRYLYA